MASLADIDTHVQACAKGIFLSVTFLIVGGGSENFNWSVMASSLSTSSSRLISVFPSLSLIFMLNVFFVSLHDHLYPEDSNIYLAPRLC